LRNTEVFYNWSKTILVNCCKGIQRKKNKVLLTEEIIEGSFEECYESKEENLDILKQMKKLNIFQQEAIKLKYFGDMDYQSIAKLSKVPVGTVKSRIATGLKKLREAFGGEY